MKPEIKNLSSRKLLGLKTKMSLADNKTGQLWARFIPMIKKIEKSQSQDKISLQIYPQDFFTDFSPSANFEKWAGVFVEGHDPDYEDLELLNIPEGKYAVFNYKGPAGDPKVFQYIFAEWLPKSGFMLDDRPHFEVLGNNYSNTSPESEEEIWIPIK
ncbi:GyrI-like domain-containing protein [Mangrovivirga sp. M17]|uniref:GyrI-like domain-containing protein n=1 Tax=Mangrovivirga halotolerans TaxID=2993936 RepID=A0ABT3RP05_9BACT|nr:GyrI-like domain-containing protein [Mangrovivirga halotolerans]MCX2743268.1 GyrI-like domain-containing protein [Mangrovivirga halotolerans]